MTIITATECALCLADLVDDEYKIVATRESYEVRWYYWLSATETALYRDMVNHGEIIAPCRRNPDGSCDVLAKLSRS